MSSRFIFSSVALLALAIPSHAENKKAEPKKEEKPTLEKLVGQASAFEELGNYSSAAEVLEKAIKLYPKAPNGILRHTGELRFFAGDIDASIAHFDELINRSPDTAPYLWQRGLSLYYAERYEDGVKQFEIHQDVNPNDVENAAWHFICVTRAEGFEEARKRLIPIKGDSRIPMAEIHDLFEGEGTPEEVLKSANREGFGERGLRNHLCYAHLYLALYFEAKGDDKKAMEHSKLAAVDYRMDHYMGICAQVHYKLRSKEKE